jgi:hypothetical protein
MSEFTKGPWRRVERLNNSDSTNNDKSCGIEGGDEDFIVAEVCGDVYGHEANAHLIAAAPELLEALKDLRSLLWTEGYADSTPAMAKADALIAKVEAA